MNPENTHESYVARFAFLTPDSKRAVLAIAQALDEITELSVTNIEISDSKDRIIAVFHKNIKSYCRERYGNELLWEQVPEAQKLIGGTLEERKNITDEQFENIRTQVLEVIAQLEFLIASQKNT